MGSDRRLQADWRRPLGAVASPVLLFVCGGLAILAVQGSLYACGLVCLLAGVWLAAWTSTRSIRPPAGYASPRAVAPKASPAPDLLANLLDQTPAPLLIRDPDGVIRAGNRAARALFGTDDRLLDPAPDLVRALTVGAPGERLTLSLPHAGAAGGLRTYAMPVTDVTHADATSPDQSAPAGAVTRLAALLDIEPELRAAEAGALRELLQVLSHEIMNALTPVASLAATAGELLEDQTPASTALAREAVATLGRRAEGLTRFVEAYRTLARLPPPRLAPTALSGLIDETARLFRSRWAALGVDLELGVTPSDLVVRLDPDLMIHALMNILSNAAEATLAAPRDTPPSVGLFVGRGPAGGVELVIDDNGPGVALEDRDRIFQPFYTTKAEGTGVGLSFARQVALSHGGTLTLAPQALGRGATFVLTL
jgi:signal transduction histidine kinase